MLHWFEDAAKHTGVYWIDKGKPCRMLKACRQRFVHSLKLILKLTTTQFWHNYCHFKTKALTFFSSQLATCCFGCNQVRIPLMLSALTVCMYLFSPTTADLIWLLCSPSQHWFRTNPSVYACVTFPCHHMSTQTFSFLKKQQCLEARGQFRARPLNWPHVEGLCYIWLIKVKSGNVSRGWVKAADSAC